MAEHFDNKGNRLESWFETYLDNERQSFIDNKPTRQLEEIRKIRLEKLQETDWWVLRGNMTEEQTVFRKSMRDIPQDYSEADYDNLLARDEQGNLTHTVWSKP
tara:strand:+ start:607 stop:915 length:309 start_codon:yes stop_codon:yes gene_type:complete